ncbi:notchless protein homolog 1 [Cryptotermes secundus]|uniref:notchless protein homolog 1 n=1 Tax=Cryptotermes secundus TaxID=105785 RepID=UPI000CD7DB2A|nr:notchless protein homolog 1 [Cryptotermes secundus]XP_023707869.1 notchless protein homolog 1 [Cryptotermes secundus]XP_033607420.1 notchless protein homolog 1 [Cryptotermes secundus]
MEEKREAVRILSRLKSETGEEISSVLDLPVDVTVDKLQLICNALLKQDENVPYIFYVNEKEIKSTLGAALDEDKINIENVVDIVYQQQAVFRVRAVTRCTSSLPGHSEAVVSASFSPDGRHLASGSGDTTVRFWDVLTQTPVHTCHGHKHWVLCLAWSPDSKYVASGCKNGHIIVWDPDTGLQVGRTMLGHKKWVTALSWEPYHSNPECRRVASGSKDGDIRIWDVVLGQTLLTLAGHSKAVTCVKWGGSGLLYTSSQDCTVKVWRADDGALCRSLEGHAHWVNTLALSTDYILRTGPSDPVAGLHVDHSKKRELQLQALKRYEAVCGRGEERLVSGSDDFTLFLWQPERDKRPVARMTGHQQLVNDVKFSVDTRLIASASFDRSIKLWDGRTGRFITSLRGHVQAVYQIAWSPDSRLLVSGSADSTLKVWNMKTFKLEVDLPGHADEVFAVDWSPDGLRVVSGSKDKVLKLWHH